MPGLTKAQLKLVEAAEHSFDRTYATQYGEERWKNSLRPALLKNTRYAMLVNRYQMQAAEIPSGAFTDDERKNLQLVDFPPPGQGSSSTVNSQSRLIAYKRGNLIDPSQPLVSTDEPFPAPQVTTATMAQDGSKGLLTHWNLDAASLLPVRLLDPVPGDRVLDLCAAPGGKSIALAQLLRPLTLDDDPQAPPPSLAGGCLHSNELDGARNKRLAANLEAYLPPELFRTGEVKVLKLDGADSLATLSLLPLGAGGYDKVLLDAPCSSERHVLHAHARARQAGKMADEMALWRSGQSKKTAKIQAALLMTALRAAKVGGRVVYATCSLSSEENDGVIERGMELVAKDRKKLGIKWDVAVRRSASAADGVVVVNGKGEEKEKKEEEELESWAERTKHGWIVLPDHPSGGRWGPLFFAVLDKIPA